MSDQKKRIADDTFKQNDYSDYLEDNNSNEEANNKPESEIKRRKIEPSSSFPVSSTTNESEDVKSTLSSFTDNELDLDLNCGNYLLMDKLYLPVGSFPTLKVPCMKFLVKDSADDLAEFTAYGDITKSIAQLNIGTIVQVENFNWKVPIRVPVYPNAIKTFCGLVRESTIVSENTELAPPLFDNIVEFPNIKDTYDMCDIKMHVGKFNAKLNKVDNIGAWNKPNSKGTYCNSHWTTRDDISFRIVAFNALATKLHSLSPVIFCVENAVPKEHEQKLEFTVGVGTTFQTVDAVNITNVSTSNLNEKVTLLELFDEKELNKPYEIAVYTKQNPVISKNQDFYQILACDSSLKDNKLLTIALHIKNNMLAAQKEKYYTVIGYYRKEEVISIKEDENVSAEHKHAIAESIKHAQKYI